MAEQLNVRIPKSTESQIDDLLAWTGMTQTQLVIQSIDRLHNSYKQERSKTVISDEVMQQYENMTLSQACDDLEEKRIAITPAALSKIVTQEYGLPLKSDEARVWLVGETRLHGKRDEYTKMVGGFAVAQMSNGSYDYFPVGQPPNINGDVDKGAQIVEKWFWNGNQWRKTA